MPYVFWWRVWKGWLPGEDVLERSAVLVMFEVILEKGSGFDNISSEETDNSEFLVWMPYLVRAECSV